MYGEAKDPGYSDTASAICEGCIDLLDLKASWLYYSDFHFGNMDLWLITQRNTLRRRVVFGLLNRNLLLAIEGSYPYELCLVDVYPGGHDRDIVFLMDRLKMTMEQLEP